MKKVLIITYYWPPSGGSGVQRWVKFAKYLPQNGWKPVIYAPENPNYTTLDPSLSDDLPSDIEVIKRPIVEPYGIYRKLFGKGSSVDINDVAAKANDTSRKNFKQRLSLFIRSNFFIPDPRVWWVRPSVRFLKKYLKDHPVDAIVSTGPPHSMHLIARKVSLATGIPWVADFRDPWTKMYWFKDLNLTKRAERKHKRLEKEVLDDATVVLSVSPFVQKDFQAMTSTPVALITNGYDEEDYDLFGDEDVVEDGFFNVTHTGVMPPDGNPDVLWRVLGKLCRADDTFTKSLRIRLLGSTDQSVKDSIESEGLMGNLVDLGYKEHKVAVMEQQNASLLILPVRKQPENKAILSGKLFEYLAAHRRILGFGDTEGAMAQVLSQTGAGIMADWEDEASTKEYVLKCWKAYQDDNEEIVSDKIEQYSRRNLTKKLSQLLDSIVK